MGEHLLVADGPYGLRVIDASDPLAPRTVGRASGFDAVGVQVHAGRAWVTELEGDQWTTRVFDVSDPTSPIQVGSYPRSFPSLAVADGYSYAPAEDGGIEVFELREGGEIRPPWAQVWLPSVVVQR